MESAWAWVGRAAERARWAPGMSSVGGRMGGAPEGKVVLCARESALSVSMLVSLRMRHSSHEFAAMNDQMLKYVAFPHSPWQQRRAGGR